MNAIERAIRENFPGKNNSGIRIELREAVREGICVGTLSRRVALTAFGLASLQAVKRAQQSEFARDTCGPEFDTLD